MQAELVGVLIAELERHFNRQLFPELQERVQAIIDRELPQRIEEIIDRELPQRIEEIVNRGLPQRIEEIVNRGLPQCVDAIINRAPANQPQLRDAIDTGEVTISKERAFEIAYGHSPSADEMDHIRRCGLADSNNDAGQLRSVVACFDHQVLPTPVTVRFTEGDLETVQVGGFRLMLDRCDVAVSRPIVYNHDHQYEPHLSGFVKRIVKPGMTVVDIGANVGFYTILLGDLVGPTGRVLSFEPYTENCRLLMINIGLNAFKHVELFPFALSTSTGGVCFASAYGTNGQFRTNTYETLVSPNCTVVPTMRLDDLISEQVHFIKVDVEGAEYLALSGGEKLIRRFHPVITSEFSLEMLQRISGIAGPDYLRWITTLGYRMYSLGRTEYRIEEIENVDNYLSSWGSFYRIEDLAFIPQEMDFTPR